MNTGDVTGPARRRRGRSAGPTAWLVMAAATISASTGLSSRPVASGSPMTDQYAAQRRVADAVVNFEFEQTNATTDQIAIVFTNVPADPRGLQAPVSGDGSVQEFVFSGREYPKERPVSFSRRVSNKAFLDCRFIRVVNRGTNRWFPLTISMTVDGQLILDKVSMYPRKGANPRGGIERWGEANPTFWETELQRFRRKAS